MKVLAYFPLVYLADVHGLILMVPYLIFCLMLLRYVQIRRAAKAPRPMPIIIQRDSHDDLLDHRQRRGDGGVVWPSGETHL